MHKIFLTLLLAVVIPINSLAMNGFRLVSLGKGKAAAFSVHNPEGLAFVNWNNENNFVVAGTCLEQLQNIKIEIGTVALDVPCREGQFKGSVDISSLPDGNYQIKTSLTSGAGAPSSVPDIPLIKSKVSDGHPIDPNANAATVKLFKYLVNLPNSMNHKTISGQMIGGLNDADPDAMIEKLKRDTGQYVGMIGIDYADHKPGGVAQNLAPLTQIGLDYAATGSIVQIGWHAANPWTSRIFNDVTNTGSLADLVDPTKPVYSAWHAQIDILAIELQKFQKAGVPVIWRPLLEMNGKWFWWGYAHGTPAQFKAVWRDLYDYLTNKKNLHNLLWAYSPNNSTPANADQELPMFYFPGIDSADIVGTDEYHDNPTLEQYDQLVATGKPVAFCEVGPHASTALNGSAFYKNLMPTIRARYPRVVYFQAWYEKFAIDRNSWASVLLNDSGVANRQDVTFGLANTP